MTNLIEQFGKHPEFKAGDGVELTGQQLAEELAAGLSVKVDAVLKGGLHLNPTKTYLVRRCLNQSQDCIKIATPEAPNNGHLITAWGTFTMHAG